MRKLILILLTFTSSINITNAQWQQTSCPSDQGIDCFAVSGTNIYASDGDGYVYLSTNSGLNWIVTLSNGLLGSPYSMAISGTKIFTGTAEGVFSSTDSGTNWTIDTNGLNGNYIDGMIISGTNIFVGTDAEGVFLSTNNGGSWTSVNNGLPFDSYANSLAISGTNIFAGTWFGDGIFLTRNNGTSWTAVNDGLPSPNNYPSINSLVISGTNIFAGTVGNGVYLSINDGASWTAVNNGLPLDTANSEYFSILSLAVSGANVYAGTYGGGVFLSTNNGGSWKAINSGLTLTDTNVYALVVNGTNIFAGTYDGVWKRPLSEILGVENISAINNDISIYPNPATNQLTIHSSYLHNEALTVSVTNVIGETMQEEKINWSNDINVNIKNLPAGIYFLEMKAENESFIKRFVKE